MLTAQSLFQGAEQQDPDFRDVPLVLLRTNVAGAALCRSVCPAEPWRTGRPAGCRKVEV